MKLEHLLVHERTKFGIGIEELAARLRVPPSEIRSL
jgi:hypothetical protein